MQCAFKRACKPTARSFNTPLQLLMATRLLPYICPAYHNVLLKYNITHNSRIGRGKHGFFVGNQRTRSVKIVAAPCHQVSSESLCFCHPIGSTHATSMTRMRRVVSSAAEELLRHSVCGLGGYDGRLPSGRSGFDSRQTQLTLP